MYHGPRNDIPRDYNPKEVIAQLNAIKENLLCVRGNCDAEVDQMVLGFSILVDYPVLDIGNHLIFATHGHRFNEAALPPFKNDDSLLNGHTHVPKCVKYEEYTYMNPGSVSTPKENSSHSYVIFENNIFLWKDLDANEYKCLTL